MLFLLAANYNIEEPSRFGVALALVAPQHLFCWDSYQLVGLIKQSLQQEVSSRLDIAMI